MHTAGYHAAVTAALILYAAGAALALWRTDAGWPSRMALALLWPLGPVAFLVTMTILLAASLIAFPLVGALVVAAGLLAWWVV